MTIWHESYMPHALYGWNLAITCRQSAMYIMGYRWPPQDQRQRPTLQRHWRCAGDFWKATKKWKHVGEELILLLQHVDFDFQKCLVCFWCRMRDIYLKLVLICLIFSSIVAPESFLLKGSEHQRNKTTQFREWMLEQIHLFGSWLSLVVSWNFWNQQVGTH